MTHFGHDDTRPAALAPCSSFNVLKLPSWGKESMRRREFIKLIAGSGGGRSEGDVILRDGSSMKANAFRPTALIADVLEV
jgi:hypothetical protein